MQTEGLPLVAQTSGRRRVAVVSLPWDCSSFERCARSCWIWWTAYSPTLPTSGWPRPAGHRPRRRAGLPPSTAWSGRATAGSWRYVASRLTGRMRLVTGMVRANRPGRALVGLSKLLVGAFGTAAIGLGNSSVWQLSNGLDGSRLAVIMLLALTALVAWLIVAHDLWEKPDGNTPAELARLLNLGTTLTLALATAVSYLVLFTGTTLAAALLIDPSVLEKALQRPVDVTDYLTLAWLISSLATVGGAIGSGLRLPSRTRRLAGRERRMNHRRRRRWREDRVAVDRERRRAERRCDPVLYATRLGQRGEGGRTLRNPHGPAEGPRHRVSAFRPA